MRSLSVGTRGSALALRQTAMVVEELKRLNPGLEVSTVIIKTTGDRITDVPLSRIGDKGLFVRELETALLERQIDLAVHSMKDLPSEMPEGLRLGAVPTRIDPSDGLISRDGGLSDLRNGSRIGSSSLRRKAQLLHFNPLFDVTDLRGNVDTRLRKLDEGLYDAIVLAFAGLHRLGLDERIVEKIPMEICLPAAGQGALALQVRADDYETSERISAMEDPESRAAVLAERSLLLVLEGGCQTPIGAYARVSGGMLAMDGVVSSPDGVQVVRGSISGRADDAASLGGELARRLLTDGADCILHRLRSA